MPTPRLILPIHRLIRYNAPDECETDCRACARIDADPRRQNIRADCVCGTRIGTLFLQRAATAATTHASDANHCCQRPNPCSHSAHAADAVSAVTNHSTPYIFTRSRYARAAAGDSRKRRRNPCSRSAHAAADDGDYPHAYHSNAAANNGAYIYAHAYRRSRITAAA